MFRVKSYLSFLNHFNVTDLFFLISKSGQWPNLWVFRFYRHWILQSFPTHSPHMSRPSFSKLTPYPIMILTTWNLLVTSTLKPKGSLVLSWKFSSQSPKSDKKIECSVLIKILKKRPLKYKCFLIFWLICLKIYLKLVLMNKKSCWSWILNFLFLRYLHNSKTQKIGYLYIENSKIKNLLGPLFCIY